MLSGSKQGRAVSAHLSDLAQDVARLEALVGELMPAEGAVPSTLLVELQVLDRLRQSLEDLSAITMVAQVNINPSSELFETLQLRDSIQILDGREVSHGDGEQAGELDLF